MRMRLRYLSPLATAASLAVWLVVAVVVVLLVAGCGGTSPKTLHGSPAGKVSTTTVTATVTAPPATPANTGYLDPATLAQALVAGYNRVPPLSDHAISGTCVVNQTTDSATCTLTTNRGRVVEPVGIAGDGSTYQAGPGMG